MQTITQILDNADITAPREIGQGETYFDAEGVSGESTTLLCGRALLIIGEIHDEDGNITGYATREMHVSGLDVFQGEEQVHADEAGVLSTIEAFLA